MINRAAEADETAAPVIAGIASLLEAWDAAPGRIGGAPAVSTARAVLTRADLAGSLPISAGAARIGGFGHPRSLLAGRMAGDQRPLSP